MRIIETKVYLFDELSDKAKQKAINWFLEASHIDDEDEFHYTIEDAKQIGLTIISLYEHRPNSGSFMQGAIECAKAIIKDHGDTCETYKTAKTFLASIESLEAEYIEDEDGERISNIDGKDNYEDKKEELEEEFLHSILEDYRIMYKKNVEDSQSDEYISDTIIANEYTFTESGKRFG